MYHQGSFQLLLVTIAASAALCAATASYSPHTYYEYRLVVLVRVHDAPSSILIRHDIVASRSHTRRVLSLRFGYCRAKRRCSYGIDARCLGVLSDQATTHRAPGKNWRKRVPPPAWLQELRLKLRSGNLGLPGITRFRRGETYRLQHVRQSHHHITM